ncbi:MAG: UbiX family flavin prenyltransferase [Rikenellaceae bacterium]
MRVIVAVTAASGSIYARQVLDLLIADESVERIALVCSDNSIGVAQYEGVTLPQSEKIVEYGAADLYAPIASGSSGWDAMIIAPCSAGTMSRVACGISDTLITRAADVMLKERRRLVLLLRETPLSLIHLRNMTTLTEAGAVIMPASPNYYHHPTNIDDLAMSVSSRAVEMCGAKGNVKEWK